MSTYMDIDPEAYLAPRTGPRGWLRSRPRWMPARIGALGLTASALFLGFNIADQSRLESARLAAANREVQRLETQRLAGDLALQRLTAQRLRAVQDYSTKYGIPAGLAATIYDVSLAEGLEPDLAFRLVRVESSFRRLAVSEAGAIGYTQIKPSTAASLDPAVSREQLFETETNLRLGFRYLSLLADQYNQDMRLALLAYNRGPARVRELLALGHDPANGYAADILQAE